MLSAVLDMVGGSIVHSLFLVALKFCMPWRPLTILLSWLYLVASFRSCKSIKQFVLVKNLVWYQFLLFFTVKLQVLVELNLEWNASTLNDFFSFVSASGNIRQLYCLQGEYTTGDGLFVVCQRHTAHGKGAVAHSKVFNVCNTRCVVCRALGKHFAECQKRHSAKIFQKNKKNSGS